MFRLKKRKIKIETKKRGKKNEEASWAGLSRAVAVSDII
jgi:hypothetical protein